MARRHSIGSCSGTAAPPSVQMAPPGKHQASTRHGIIGPRWRSPRQSVCHLRRLRHPDRLGHGRLRRIPREAERDGFTIERDELIPLFHEIQQQIEAGSYELYAEVLRRTAVQIAKRLGWPLEPSRSGFLPDSVQRWMPFKETNPVLPEDRQEVQGGADLEHRRQAARPDPPPHPARFRPRRDGAAGPLLQARPGPLHRVRAADRLQEGVGAHRRELLPRHRAVLEEEDPGDLGQSQQAAARARDRRSPTRRFRACAKRRS